MKLLQGHYKGLLLVVLGITFALFLSTNEFFHTFISNLGAFGYIGAFVAGMFFVSTFTVASAVLVLLLLSHQLPTWQVSLIAGLGATLGNYLLFLFIKEKIVGHVKQFAKTRKRHHRHLLFQHHSHWLLPFAGLIFMATPLPDELGILLLSIFEMRTYQFVLISFTLKTAGIYALLANINFFS
jgi:membrane protein YqaA with SNARE-associated domain